MEGGTQQDPGPGIAKIKPLAQSAVLLHTQADQVVSLFERGEIDIAVWYPDRAGVAIKGGLPLAVAIRRKARWAFARPSRSPRAHNSRTWR